MGKEELLKFAHSDHGTNASTPNFSLVAKHEYLGIYNLGLNGEDISFPEIFRVNLRFSKFMEEKCFFVSEQALESTEGISWLKEPYDSIFKKPKELDEYVGVVSIKNGIIGSKPHFLPLGSLGTMSSEHTVYDKVDSCLKKLHSMLSKSRAVQFPWPELPPASQNMVFANGVLIQRLKNEQDLSFDKMAVADNPITGGTSKVNKQTIMKARDSDLVKPHVLEHLSYCLNVPESDLALTNMIPNLAGLSMARKIIASHGKSGVKEWFGALSDAFFDSLVDGEALSSKTMKFIYHHYKKTCEASLNIPTKLEDVVDLCATEALIIQE